MRRVEKTVSSVGGPFASELVVRETKCNETEVGVTGERLGETALGNRLGLDYAGNDHDANGGM